MFQNEVFADAELSEPYNFVFLHRLLLRTNVNHFYQSLLTV